MTVQNYWGMIPQQQARIKEEIEFIPLYTWRVQGQLNVAYSDRAYGFPVNQTIEAADETEAADEVAKVWGSCYNGSPDITWLNDGPVVFKVRD